MKSIVKIIAITVTTIFSFSADAQNQQQFTTAGLSTFVAPQGVLTVKAECIGGGGGGGRVRGSSARESGGGGGGAYAQGLVTIIPGNSYQVYVGESGVQNSTVPDGRHGGNSYFNSETSTDQTTTVRAEGGRTLILSDGSFGTGEQGGKAINSVGNRLKYDGGNGGSTDDNDYGGGGGGAAGSNGPGGNGNLSNFGFGTNNYGGNGGVGGLNGGDDDGTEGFLYGGAGGGARKSFSGSTQNRYGAAGASGIVVVSWCTITDFSPSNICGGASETVSITGTNFTSIDSVSVNGINVPFTLNGTTEIIATIGNGISTGNIIVYSENGSAISSTPLTINTYTLSVSISGIQLTANHSGTSAANYQWINCVTNSPISGAQAPTFSPTQNGIYAVSVSENTCTITSECLVISSLEVDDLEVESTVSIYPNPSNGQFTLISEIPTDKVLRIIDFSGKEIYNARTSSTNETFSIEHLNAGTYIIEINSNTTRIVQKLIVTK